MEDKRKGRARSANSDRPIRSNGISTPRRHGQRSGLLGLIALLVFAGAIVLALGISARRARGEEATNQPPAGLPTTDQTRKLLENPNTPRLEEQSETDPQAAHELPHRDLGRDEALKLTDAVFGAELEGVGGVIGEIEPERFLSDFAAVVPISTLPEPPGQEIGEPEASNQAGQAVVIESTLPLRTENADGADEAVDLSLERSDGGLTPVNPLADVSMPTQLGDGVSLPGVDVQIEVAGVPDERAPTNVKGEYAFYPNVAENTDLVVAPTASGLEMLTSIRSADAPQSTTYRLGPDPLRWTRFGLASSRFS